MTAPEAAPAPLRIVQVIAAISETYGGPSIGALELHRELSRSGVASILMTTSLRSDDGTTMSTDEENRVKAGAFVRTFRPSRPYFLKNSWGLLRGLRSETATVDLIHIHGQYLFPNVFAYLAARRHSVRYGVQPHGSLEPYQRAQSRLKKGLYNALIGSRIMKNASYVLFATELESANARDVVDPARAIVVALGATLPEPQSIPAVVQRIDGRPREKVVLFLGRLARKKRPDLLIRAWAEVSRPTGSLLLIAGPDDSFTAAELTLLAGQMGVADSVMLVGHATAEEKSWLYAASGTFVLASENENFGITVTEAMTAGCHIICTEAVAASHLLVEAGAGAVLPELTVSTLAASITLALTDPDAQAESAIVARKFAAEHVSWKPLAAVLEDQAILGRQSCRVVQP